MSSTPDISHRWTNGTGSKTCSAFQGADCGGIGGHTTCAPAIGAAHNELTMAADAAATAILRCDSAGPRLALKTFQHAYANGTVAPAAESIGTGSGATCFRRGLFPLCSKKHDAREL
jgi:hypothetical protein